MTLAVPSLRNALLWFRSTFISIPLIILGTALAALCALALRVIAPNRRLLDSCKRVWSRYILAVCFVRPSVYSATRLDPAQNYVFCANHLSYLDPPLLAAVLPVPVRFIAKRSLFSIPLFGWAMRAIGDVSVDRENARSAVRSVARAAELLRSGSSLVVFPEGGRSLDGNLQPFLPGAFHLAIHAGAPVVPVVIQGTREALRPGSLFIRGGPVRVSIGPPIPTRELTLHQKHSLARQVEEAMRQMFE